MSNLSVTLIDVGWGDSVLLTWDDAGTKSLGLVDSNDTVYLRSSYIFLKRMFEKMGIDTSNKPVFDFVILSHAHSDHGQGLQAIMSEFGTKHFWYPKSAELGSMASLVRYARRSTNVLHHQSVDATKILPSFGATTLSILWPYHNQIAANENNNSIVLNMTYGNVTVLLTGDAEGDVWQQVAPQLPPDVSVFKVPHHGSVNGTFHNNQTPWLDACPQATRLLISSHVRPFSHPDQQVVDAFDARSMEVFRTDEHYHITATTDGHDVEVKYSHV